MTYTLRTPSPSVYAVYVKFNFKPKQPLTHYVREKPCTDRLNNRNLNTLLLSLRELSFDTHNAPDPGLMVRTSYRFPCRSIQHLIATILYYYRIM